MTSQRMVVSHHSSSLLRGSFICLRVCCVQRAGNSKVFSKQVGKDVAERSDSAQYKRPAFISGRCELQAATHWGNVVLGCAFIQNEASNPGPSLCSSLE